MVTDCGVWDLDNGYGRWSMLLDLECFEMYRIFIEYG